MQEHPKGLSLLDTTIIRFSEHELLHLKLMQLLCTGSCSNIYVSMNIWKDSKKQITERSVNGQAWEGE